MKDLRLKISSFAQNTHKAGCALNHKASLRFANLPQKIESDTAQISLQQTAASFVEARLTAYQNRIPEFNAQNLQPLKEMLVKSVTALKAQKQYLTLEEAYEGILNDMIEKQVQQRVSKSLSRKETLNTTKQVMEYFGSGILVTMAAKFLFPEFVNENVMPIASILSMAFSAPFWSSHNRKRNEKLLQLRENYALTAWLENDKAKRVP